MCNFVTTTGAAPHDTRTQGFSRESLELDILEWVFWNTEGKIFGIAPLGQS